MAINPLNQAFLLNSRTFIAQPEHAISGHDDLIQATKGTRKVTIQRGTDTTGTPDWLAANTLTNLIDATGVISFDFKPFRHARQRMIVMTPICDTTLFTLPAPMRRRFCRPSDNPVRGYWFPYIAKTPQIHARARRGGGGPPSVMGWVDIPMHVPAHSFAFTGSMQGCHIVVTQSPANPLTHFRVYHYPSPATYWATPGNMTFNQWPSATAGRICAWFDDTMYEHEPPDAVDAFNFLHHDGANWYIQTQKQHRTTIIQGRTALVLFRVVGGTVTGPIPTRPIPIGRLFEHATQWRQRRGITEMPG